MKILPEHYAVLTGAIPNTHATSMRARWDALYGVRIDGLSAESWVCKHLYPYLNDTHIATALRAIMPGEDRP